MNNVAINLPSPSSKAALSLALTTDSISSVVNLAANKSSAAFCNSVAGILIPRSSATDSILAICPREESVAGITPAIFAIFFLLEMSH